MFPSPSILSSLAIICGALSSPAVAAKPVGGPASATVTVYSGPFTCANENTVPPTNGAAGTATTISIAENQCVIIPIPLGGVFTTSMTATPKTGTAACYIQTFTQQGCGSTLQNQYHGFPFDGIILGSKVGCAAVPVQSYGALEIVCA